MLSSKANIICLTAAILTGSLTSVQAQIIPDDTLGDEASQVSVDATVQGLSTELIEGGATRGVNLFHSFADFNVADLQRVYFANPTNIENILSRITGDNRSNILGTLGVDGTANLFLLNPNGIVFGENAQLDITGSFFASTADALELDGGLSYSAVEPTAPPLLAVTLTPGLQYGAAQQGEISNAGTLQTGESLTLNADTLTLNGSLLAGTDLTLLASDTIQIRDSEAQPFIAAAIGDVLVQGDQTVDIFALNHSDSGLFAGRDLILRSINSVVGDTHYWSGNRFQVETLDGLPGNLLSPNDPVIQSGGDISFANYTGASLRVLAGGSVTANNLTITGTDPGFPDETVTLSRPLADGTNTVQVNGSTRPVVDIRAGTTAAMGGLSCNGCPSFLGILLQPADLSSSITPTSADITINRIAVNPSDGLVVLTNQFQPDTSLDGSIQVQEIDTRNTVARGGEVILDSRNSIVLPTSSLVRSSALDQNSGNISFIAQDAVSLAESAIVQSASGGTGQAGNINVIASSLSLLREAQLDASATGNGDAGNSGAINIDVNNAIALTGFNTRIDNSVDVGARADTGEINIRANSLSIEEGAGIFSTILGEGNGSNITLDINGAVVLDGRDGSNSAIATGVGDSGSGNSGPINLRAGSLSLTNGGLIGSFADSNNSISNAGDINLDVRDFILIRGDAPLDSSLNASPFIFSNNSSIASGKFGDDGTGNSGTVTVNTDQLLIQDGGVINALHTGQGQGGDIEINARVINFSGVSDRFLTPSAATTAISSEATAGKIILNADEISIVDGAAAVTTTEGTGNGGDIEITANRLNLLNGGQVLANATDVGNAGNINIENTERILISGFDPSFFARKIRLMQNNPGSDLVNVSADSGLYASSRSTGNSGEILISNVENIDIRDRGRITTVSEETGNAGVISITDTNSITLDSDSEISTSSFTAGDSGSLLIETNTLSLNNDSGLVTATVGSGDAGLLNIQANLVELLNNSRITTDTGSTTLLGTILFPNSTGDAGNLNIDTNRLVLQDGEISASASIRSSGRAGTLTVNAIESVDISGTDGTNTGGLFASSFGTGAGGDLFLRTGQLNIQDGGRIESGSAGLGQGGSVDVLATELITVSGTSAALTTQQIAGLLDATGLVEVSEGSETRTFLRSGISAFSLDQGEADSGSVRVATNGNLIVRDNAEITTAVLGGGNANNVEVNANSLELRDSARINSRNEGTGFAGNILVETQSLLRSTGGEVSASSDLAGGGDITITTDNLLLSNGSLLSTSVFDSTGGGGNITIDANAFAAIEDSDILANAELGLGGIIDINSPAFLATLFESGRATPVGRNPGSFAQFRGNNRVDISADSAGGQSGTVSLSTLVTDEGLNELPTNLIDPTSLIDQRCDLLASQQSQNSQTSQFTVVGRGGLPLTPEQQLEATQLLDDLGPQEIQPNTENFNAEVVTTAPAEIPSERIVEPLGWQRSEDGRLYLYASASVSETAETHLAQRCAESPSSNQSSVSSR